MQPGIPLEDTLMAKSVRVVDTERRDDGTIIKRIQPRPDDTKVWREEKDNGPDEVFIRVPISSTSEDRDGDEFSHQGLDKTQEQLESGEVPYYLDHGLDANGIPAYRVGDMAGHWVDAERDGDVLYGIARGEPGNEDFHGVAAKIEAGLPVGHSVGFRAIETEEKDAGGHTFLDVDLMEVSAVGIPSNPDAVSHQVNVMAKRAGTTPEHLLQAMEEGLGEVLDVDPDTLQREDDPMSEETTDEKDAPNDEGDGLTEDEVRSIVSDQIEKETADLTESIVEGVTEKVSGVLEEKMNDEDHDDEDDEDEDEEQQSSDPSSQKQGDPKGIGTATDAGEGKQAEPQGQPTGHHKDIQPLTPAMQKVGPIPKDGDDA